MAAGAMSCQPGLRQEVSPAYATPMTGKDEERARRLAEALRENLRRRKAQARGEDSEPTPSQGKRDR
jgi:uncharacterized protein involved in type VI secretion and phage assembly